MGLVGFMLNKGNLVHLLMALELFLLGVNTEFIIIGSLQSHVMVLFVMGVAAGEAAIGLALVLLLFRKHKQVHLNSLEELRG